MAERDLDRARHVVLVPDLMTYWLSGQLGTELMERADELFRQAPVLEEVDVLADKVPGE